MVTYWQPVIVMRTGALSWTLGGDDAQASCIHVYQKDTKIDMDGYIYQTLTSTIIIDQAGPRICQRKVYASMRR